MKIALYRRLSLEGMLDFMVQQPADTPVDHEGGWNTCIVGQYVHHVARQINVKATTEDPIDVAVRFYQNANAEYGNAANTIIFVLGSLDEPMTFGQTLDLLQQVTLIPEERNKLTRALERAK